MKSLTIGIKMLVVMTIITGIIYPLIIYLIGHGCFPNKANGSLIMQGNKIIGSVLIAQKFESNKYFHCRPSAIDYNPLPSGASNYGLTNKKLDSLVKTNKKEFITKNFLNNNASVPSEMLFNSASGLDPHISPQAAILQVKRIVIARNFNNIQQNKLLRLIYSLIEKPQFLLFGDERINVLLLNLELEKI
jgi:potassium-transporting ATPase KdpC subunit